MPSKGPPPPHPTFLRFLMTKAGKGGGSAVSPSLPPGTREENSHSPGGSHMPGPASDTFPPVPYRIVTVKTKWLHGLVWDNGGHRGDAPGRRSHSWPRVRSELEPRFLGPRGPQG